jgi:ABC-type lipoprotein export system ATPase subunit/ABC-type antimicrobial peptide transport system permease subunit
MELIRLEDITKTYYLGEVDVPVLKGISLSIRRGEMVALMGASGSGKTTLMNILGCLDRPTSGKFWFDGDEMSQLTPNQRALVRTAKLGFVFQSFNLLARTTAVDNVIMPLDYSPTPPQHHEAWARALTLLGRVGLADRTEHESSQMSGGQQQRVAIARSLINRPALLLADEPTGNLDSHTSVEILRMFQKLNKEGITVILVTHDPKVASFADRTVRIADGLIERDDVSPVSGDGQLSMVQPHSDRAAVNGFFDGDGNSNHGNGNGSGVKAGVAAVALADGDSGLAVGVSRVADAAPAEAVAETEPEIETDEEAAAAALKPPRLTLGSMLPPTFRTAMKALRRNKMRSFLTALGVIIGVGAVIAMMEIGNGSKTAIEKTIASMGANNILVLPGAAATGGVSFGVGSVMTLTPQDVDEIASQCPAVSDAAPVVRARPQIIYLHSNWIPNTFYGTTPSFLAVRDWEDLSEGDIFTDLDVRNQNKVCLVGETLKRELFQNESPVGKEIRIQNVTFKVIGVLSRKGANMVGQDQDDIVLAPWTTVKYRLSGNSGASLNASTAASSITSTTSSPYATATAIYPAMSATQAADTPQPLRLVTVDQIYCKAAAPEQVHQAIEEITSLLRERHRLRPAQIDDFNIRDMTELTKTMSSQSTVMGVLLMIVASVSLVVGGVGIMNIMLVSVTERTREIGLRMAVGARSYHILRQFLVEAVVLCLIGGGIGILVGRSLSIVVRSIMRWPTQPSLPAICLAVLVSAGVGIVFGFYPAWKASRLDPIEALRYE